MLLIQSLINSKVQQFIADHEHDDERALVLKHKTVNDVPSSIIAEQISGKRKTKFKIPLFYSTSNIVYPPGINLEQCSSQATAEFKASHFQGKNFADLTGGLGIDTFFFSKQFKSTHYVEPNQNLLNIAKHNHEQLHSSNINYHVSTAETFINTTDLHFDLIYLDPSRRLAGNQKVYKLSDCEPNVVELQEAIFNKCDKLLIKISPLFDIQQGLKELRFVKNVFVVSLENECKELLFLCDQSLSGEPEIKTVNLLKDEVESFEFYFSDERKIDSIFSDPKLYLYEPNASILKAGAFKSIAKKFELAKLHPSTHLYTADHLIKKFPGRIFKIEGFVKANAHSLKDYFPSNKANITTRNYPLTPEQLKKKTGLVDGGEKYLIGFSGVREKYLAVGLRVK